MININQQYLTLEKLETYKYALKLSDIVWKIYEQLDWHAKKVTGDQFVEATDSIGANIAEGYGRFHYLDKIKFYYNSRGSLLESRHWFNLIHKRKLIKDDQLKEQYLETYKKIRPLLNGLINSTYKQKVP
jgi:four helix bundle protein